MSDFLDALEGELLRAARRRARPTARRLALGDDLRAVGRGGLATVSAAVVVMVAAVVIVFAGHRAAVPGDGATPPPAGASTAMASPCPGVGEGRADDSTLAAWLSTAAPVSAAADQAALRELHRSGARVAAVSRSDIRRVRLPGVGPITLVAARRCADGATMQLLAEVPVPGGVATVDLGSAAAIRSGAAFATTGVLVHTPRGLRSVSVLPAWAVRVVCHETDPAGATRSYTAFDHLVALAASERPDHCRMQVS